MRVDDARVEREQRGRDVARERRLELARLVAGENLRARRGGEALAVRVQAGDVVGLLCRREDELAWIRVRDVVLGAMLVQERAAAQAETCLEAVGVIINARMDDLGVARAARDVYEYMSGLSKASCAPRLLPSRRVSFEQHRRLVWV